MEGTWTSRDLPVLEAVVELLDQGNYMVLVRDIVELTGFEPAVVDRALTALEGDYVVEYEQFATGGDPSNWRVRRVTSDARRAVGQWPTPENLITSLAAAFDEAAEREPDVQRKGKLREVASFLVGTGREVATEVAAKVILRQTGMG